ncbi:MAG: hypothetical protein J7L15_01040 [Clostridiales bacterium]|nr:hypothetical protein [Clostridiales bacterium]
MKNPYSLYYLSDLDGTKIQIDNAKKVQRKVTAMISKIIKLAKAGDLSNNFVKEQKREFSTLNQNTGVQDTTSRETIGNILEQKLIKQAGYSKHTAYDTVGIWWEA